MKVTNIKLIDISPKISDPEVRKLLPTVLTPQRYEFTISGVNNAIANAIRRVICLELPVKAMIAEYADLKTDDPHIIPEMIIQRLRSIPLKQSCPMNMTFEIATVAGHDVTEVKSGLIKPIRGQALFNETFNLVDLQPGKSFSIKNIRVQERVGNVMGDGMHAVAMNVVAIPVDIRPEEGSSSVLNPTVYRIEFNTNGSMDPKEIVVAACNNIIARLNHVQTLVHTITNNGDEYHLMISNETATVGNLLMRELDQYTVTYDVNNGMCRLRIRLENAGDVISAAIKSLIKRFTAIITLF